MPSLYFRVTATTTDALSNRKFSVVPPRGAILNAWLSAATATDTYGLSIGDRDIMVNGSVANVEAAASVVDTDRDQTIFNELVGGGQLFLPVTLTTRVNVLLHLRYL